MQAQESRVTFLDYLRVIACFMVICIHSTEPYYLNADGFTLLTKGNFGWIALVECICRACVPLFVMTSAYLLFPVKRSTGEFFKRRLIKVVVPFFLWSVFYVWLFNGKFSQLCFNFPDAGGHLWFVPMLLGLYLLMPLLSPWAERVSERELRGWLILWGVTLLFPYARRLWLHLYGAPSFGAVAYLWGECPWNEFGAFRYVSGFLGYMLLGFWFRKFAPAPKLKRDLAIALPLWVLGAAIMAGGLWLRLPEGGFPVHAPYASAVEFEMSIEYCSLGVAMTVIAGFLMARNFTAEGALYRKLVLPLSKASYGIYLVHLAILLEIAPLIQPKVSTPAGIALVAFATFTASALFSLLPSLVHKKGS